MSCGLDAGLWRPGALRSLCETVMHLFKCSPAGAPVDPQAEYYCLVLCRCQREVTTHTWSNNNISLCLHASVQTRGAFPAMPYLHSRNMLLPGTMRCSVFPCLPQSVSRDTWRGAESHPSRQEASSGALMSVCSGSVCFSPLWVQGSNNISAQRTS